MQFSTQKYKMNLRVHTWNSLPDEQFIFSNKNDLENRSRDVTTPLPAAWNPCTGCTRHLQVHRGIMLLRANCQNYQPIECTTVNDN